MCVSPYISQRKDGSPVAVPCGYCVECLQAYQRDWSFRLSEELKRCTCPVFITLTYDDDHLPLGDDEYGNTQSLVLKSDLQKFFKRLRKNGGKLMENMRYFAVGEYGFRYNRAHYHAVIIAPNLPNVYVMDSLVRKSWRFGFVKVRYCTPKQIDYVTKYVNKLDNRVHLVKPFRMMSKSIGLNYLTDAVVSYFLSTFSKTVLYKGYKVRLPRYYQKKLDQMSESHPFLKRAGLSYSDLLDVYCPYKGSKLYWYDYFEKHFDEIFARVRGRIHYESLKYGYNDFIPSRNQVFQIYSDSIRLLCVLKYHSNRVISDVAIKGGLKYSEKYHISKGLIESNEFI